MPTLGNLGERLNLKVRAGTSLGPFMAQMSANDLPFDLTSCAIRASARTAFGQEPETEFDVQITEPAAGEYQFGLTPAQTVELADTRTRKMVWDMELELPDGQILALYYGALTVEPAATSE